MITAVVSEKEQIESELQSDCVTRLLPGACEKYIEKITQQELEKAQIEAVFKIADDKKEKNQEIEELSLFERISFNFWKLESLLGNHMWIIALVWLVLSGLHKLVGISFISAGGSLLTKPAGPPVPFFPNFSRGIVDDHYFGNNAAPEDLLRKSEIAILMYYAPWSLDAMETRKPFIEVATSFQFISTIKFSAVNCNTKYGKCRKAFKLYSYPVIVGYVGNTFVQYNGPQTAIGMFRFVRHLLKPVVKLYDLEDLQKDFKEFKYLVIGYFPITSENTFKEYTTFVATALKSGSNFDKFGSTKFVVIQNAEVAKALELDWTNRIRVYGNYEKSKKPLGTAFTVVKITTSEDILNWIETKIEKENYTVDIPWLHLDNLESGGKSEQLFKFLNESPTALLFTTDYGGFAESKIDTMRNELLYQYSFERVPALMFFPARQLDSSRYPNELPFTIPNILAFVLSRCQPELRWRIALSSCSSVCIRKNKMKLKKFSSNIEADLRKLRITRFHESRKATMTSGVRLNFLRIAIQRRILQKRAALHLDNVLSLLESGKKLNEKKENQVIKDSLFVRWLLYNHFGLNFSD